MFRLRLLLLAALLLPGIASSETPMNYAVLIITRDRLEVATPCDIGIYLQDQLVARLYQGQATSFNLPAGKLSIRMGMLGGIAFAIFYTTFGIPIAILADRTSRTKIMAVAAAMWSGFTMLCGLTTNFWQLLLARIGVGIGEAGGSPPAHSIISDLYEPKQRATAKSLGLRKIGQSVIREDNSVTRGMILTVRHLVTVEEAD